MTWRVAWNNRIADNLAADPDFTWADSRRLFRIVSDPARGSDLAQDWYLEFDSEQEAVVFLLRYS